MKNFIYFFIAVLFAFVSCEKENFETEATAPSEELTDVDFRTHKKFVTVVGQNNPAEDILAVQNAVDTHDNIELSGTFDFGLDELNGGVDINRPNVILKGPATIVNGAKTQLIAELGLVKYPLSIRAPGIELRGLEISGDHDGVLIYATDKGKPVILEDNNITGNTAAVAGSQTSGGVKLLNNRMEAVFGYFALGSEGDTQIIGNEITSYIDGVRMFDFEHKLDILDNIMVASGFDAIWIGAWRVTKDSGPEWGENAPVRVTGNTIEITDPFAAGIMIGSSADGINNVTVKDNVLTGVAGYGGLMKQPYGHNNRFMNNDLSGLTTYSPQIWILGGYNSHYKNNALGPVEAFSMGAWGPAFKDAGTLVSPINWHDNDGLNTPDPVHFGNHISNNDYSLTGVPGWTDDPDDSSGAVLLLDFLQKFDEFYNSIEVPFVMENFVNEKTFPAGTDLCTQVLDLNPGSNHITGWNACVGNMAKSPVSIAVDRYKNQSQWIKEMIRNRVRPTKLH
ncbi:MAG: hypothetical protein WBM43_09280 [Flavobacteriaceae bacterium]